MARCSARQSVFVYPSFGDLTKAFVETKTMARQWKMLSLTLLAGSICGGEAWPQGQPPNNNIHDPYSLYAPYYPGYSWDPGGGYLRGAADVIRSQGQLMVNQQQAYLLREQVRSAAYDTRRKKLEQELWERNNLPTPEDNRELYISEQLRRSRNDPPDAEIWSGTSMNALLRDLRNLPAPAQDLSEPLAPELLEKLNLTSDKSHGNLSQLKDGTVPWPHMIRYRSEFEEQRALFERLIAQAVEQAKKGKVYADVAEDLERCFDHLRECLRAMAKSSSPSQYLMATGFLDRLERAVSDLQGDEAREVLTGQCVAEGNTIAELVNRMKNKGYIFGPALSDGKAVYRAAVYIKLRNYDEQIGSKVREKR
jgi:hypothetical protein